MALHPLAGKTAPLESLVDVSNLVARYYDQKPDLTDPAQRVAFGTSGHRGSAARNSFNESHILAIAQAVVEYRAAQGTTGPLFVGRDSHALSEPAQRTVLRVLAAHHVQVLVAAKEVLTPTPVISHAIITHNRGRTAQLADGLIITPSHNPPDDGGIKYNPPHGGPADTDATGWIERRANELLAGNNNDVRALTDAEVGQSTDVRTHDFITPYVADLSNVVDIDIIRSAKLRLGVDPLGGSNVGYWQPIVEKYGLDITVVNPNVDPTFRFVPLDHDGKIRTDCSSRYAMAGLIAMRDKFDLAFGNDADSDRHGIVTRSAGLMNPNHFLAVAIEHLYTHRSEWPGSLSVGKTLVSSAMIDRVASRMGRTLYEVPVGFKWFVPGLSAGTMGFGGEESAGASFLRRNGQTWTTDKDGIIMDLLAAEIMARTGKDPSEHYARLEAEFGVARYARIDRPASAAQKKILKSLTPDRVATSTLAGDPITARSTRAPGNNAEIGGLKVSSTHGWFAARPSGTEDAYKIYAESFRGEQHLEQLLTEASEIVDTAFKG